MKLISNLSRLTRSLSSTLLGIGLILAGGSIPLPAVAEAPPAPAGFRIVPRRTLQPAPYIGHPLPPIQLEKLDGGNVDSSQWSGRPVVLNFWATWSDASLGDVHILQETYSKWGKDVQVVGIEISKGQKQHVQRFVGRNKLTYPILLDAGTVAQAYRILAVPTTFFIDRDGTIRDLQIGALQAQSLEQRLKRMIK